MIKQEITELLKHTELETIISFVAEYATQDNNFYEKIKEALLPDDEDEICDIDFYRVKAEDCFDFGRRHYNYYEAAYEAALRLDSILNDADYYTEQGKYADAAAMAMAVVEVIPRNYEDVDDSGGDLGGTFGEAINLLCKIVNNQAVAVSVKKEIYDWSKDESGDSIYSDYGFSEIKTIYETCCEQLGDTDEVIADMNKQIKEAKSEYYKSDAVLRKIRFMQSRNMDIENVVQTHIDLNEVRKIRFNQLIDDKKYNEALHIAEQGIEIAQQKDNPGTVAEWKKFIFDVYLAQDDRAKLLPMAEYLFLHAGWGNSKDKYYNALKEYTPAENWSDTVERLLAAAEKERSFGSFTARIMQEHQMWKRLFDYCSKGSIGDMEEYEKDLKPFYEKEILEYYRAKVEKKALITDQHAYDEVAHILKRMKTFSEGNVLVNQLLDKYRATYKRRKNMMVALNDV